MSEELEISLITLCTSIAISAILALLPMLLMMRKSRLQQRCRIAENLLYKRYCDIQFFLECRDELLARLSKETGKSKETLKRDIYNELRRRNFKLSRSTHKSFVNDVVRSGPVSIGDFIEDKLINSIEI